MATRSSLVLPWESRRALGLLARGRWKRIVGVGMVAAILVALVLAGLERSKVRSTRAMVARVQRAVAIFRSDNGRCPTSLVELVHPPRPEARTITDVPRDGWGRILHVRCPGRNHSSDADVISAGPDGAFATTDDIN